MRLRQYDAHVRARQALARVVVNRRYDWGLTSYVSRRQMDSLGWERFNEILFASALDAISAHVWPEGWGDKLSTYSPFGPKQHVVGTYVDVPVIEVHKIMCDVGDYLKRRFSPAPPLLGEQA